jgi:hypothetical protein
MDAKKIELKGQEGSKQEMTVLLWLLIHLGRKKEGCFSCLAKEKKWAVKQQ